MIASPVQEKISQKMLLSLGIDTAIMASLYNAERVSIPCLVKLPERDRVISVIIITIMWTASHRGRSLGHTTTAITATNAGYNII